MKQPFDRMETLDGEGTCVACETGETGIGTGATGACLASHASRHAILKGADF